MQNNHTAIHPTPADTPAWEYHIVAERCTHPDIGVYRSYGIHAFEVIHNHIRPVTQIHDITTDQEHAETLVQLCNKHQASPVHLKDLVQDFLYMIL